VSTSFEARRKRGERLRMTAIILRQLVLDADMSFS
jgi:hypothetical protein